MSLGDVVDVLVRPHPLRDGGGLGPDPGLEVEPVDPLAPHGGLQPDQRRPLLLRELVKGLLLVHALPSLLPRVCLARASRRGRVVLVQIVGTRQHDGHAAVDHGAHHLGVLPHVSKAALGQQGGLDVQLVGLPHPNLPALQARNHLRGHVLPKVVEELGVRHVVLLEPLGDLGVLQPARGVHLVAAQENVLGRKDLQHLFQKGQEERVHLRVGGVQHVLAAHQTRVALAPRPVARHVELWHHGDSPARRVLDYVREILRLVHGVRRERALLGEVGEGLALQREGLRVHDVPVQNVVPVEREDVQNALDVRHRQEVPRRVQQEPPEGEPGLVPDPGLQNAGRGGVGGVAQLGQGHQAVVRAVHVVCLDEAVRVRVRRHRKPEGLVRVDRQGVVRGRELDNARVNLLAVLVPGGGGGGGGGRLAVVVVVGFWVHRVRTAVPHEVGVVLQLVLELGRARVVDLALHLELGGIHGHGFPRNINLLGPRPERGLVGARREGENRRDQGGRDRHRGRVPSSRRRHGDRRLADCSSRK